MDPLVAKAIAATSGATLTALTSEFWYFWIIRLPFHPLRSAHAKPLSFSLLLTIIRTVTPFDVVKTRLQTQMPHQKSQAAVQTCRHAPHLSCARSMSSYAPSISTSSVASTSSKFFMKSSSKPLSEELCLCLYEGNTVRAQRVTGFWDALIQVARFEGVRGLWKGVGTTL